MAEISIELDFLPPSANCQYQHRRNRIYLSSKLRDFQKRIAEILKTKNKLNGNVSLDIVFCMADRRKRDLDNLLKPLIDCLKNVVIEDDCMIYEINCRKLDYCEKFKTIIHIKEMN